MDDHEVKVVGEHKPEDENVEAFGLPEPLEEFHRQPEMTAL
jgi:hypothetical protein